MLIDVTIEGQTPLLCNKFTDAAAMAATNGSRTSAVAGDKGTPREQAEARLYIGQDSKCVIPQPNVFRAIIDAGTFFKAGKSKITTQKSTLIPTCVSIPSSKFPLNTKTRGKWIREQSESRAPAAGFSAIGPVSTIGSSRSPSTWTPTSSASSCSARFWTRPASGSDWETSGPRAKGRSASSS